MNSAIVRSALTALLVAGLAGCAEDEQVAGAPAPAALDRDAIGYYCSMIVSDHKGPKGQIHLREQSEPVWFSSARDAIAFTMLPDEPKSIAAVYVNDMGRASWDSPEPDTWIEAREAWFVVGSSKVGGMGAPETVPFAERAAADRFASAHGGTVMRFEDVPEEAVLGAAAAPPEGTAGGGSHGAHVDTYGSASRAETGHDQSHGTIR